MAVRLRDHYFIAWLKVVKEKGKTHFRKVCRERAVQFFDKNDRYQDYVDLYEGLMSKKIKR